VEGGEEARQDPGNGSVREPGTWGKARLASEIEGV
jgi:hypothetical protein